MTWSRRRALGVLASGALAPWVAGSLSCAAPARQRRRPGPAVVADFDAVTADALTIASDLRGRVPNPAIDLSRRRRLRAAVDATERLLEALVAEGAVLSATSDDGRRIEVATSDTTSAGLRAAADLLAEQARASGLTAGSADDAPIADAPDVALHADAPTAKVAALADRARELFARSRNAGGSRIVYRGAQLDIEDTRTLHVGPAGVLRQRVVRGLADVLLVASAGARSYADRARVGAVGDLADLDLDRRDIESAADNALALLASRPFSRRATTLLLAPEVAATLAGQAIARRFAATAGNAPPSRGSPLGSPLVTVVDRPRDAGYGLVAFDDRGRASGAIALVENGVAGVPLATARRATPTGPAVAAATNLVWPTTGDAAGADLIGGTDGGVLLEGALEAILDPAGELVTLRAARGREIAGGQLSGRLYGPVVARGTLEDLLGAVDAVAGTGRTFAARVDGLPMSVTAPFVRTRGEVSSG